MSRKLNMVAFDCSNSNIRTIIGKYDNGKLKIETVSQDENYMVRMNEAYYWDIPYIFRNMLKGLKKAASSTHIDSIGVCTWGVDFAMFSKEGAMLSNPLAYRNSFGEEILNGVSEEDRKELFNRTGILCDKINSAYMLGSIRKNQPSLYNAGERILMIPDIFNYLLTGIMANEQSELSTTQLFDVSERKISKEAINILGLDSGLFGETPEHGTLIGYLRKDIREQLGIEYEIPVICVPSHDTASAVLAVPAEEREFAFISNGTWALIGSEADEPIITDEVRTAGFTNELGAFGKITLLKNNMGMYIAQRLKEELDPEMGWEEFYDLSEKCSEEDAVTFDVNDGEFFNPDVMGTAIYNAIGGKGNVDYPLIIRSYIKSLAKSYAECITTIEKIRKRNFDRIYIVGGGLKNRRLNNLISEYTGKKVVTGSSESTSCGNFLAQIKYFEPEKDLADLRKIIIDSI